MNTDVFIDNRFVGTVPEPKAFVQSVVQERRQNEINPQVNIHYDNKQEAVYIETARGRATRPLIIVEDGEPALTDDVLENIKEGDTSWGDLIKQGVIEYLDAMEEEDALIAFDEDDLTEDHTHLKHTSIHTRRPTTSTTPFENTNQGIRTN